MAGEATLAFVDTNVLLYAYDATAGKRHELAAELVGELGANRRGAVSVQVLQEFYVNATSKIAEPLRHDVAIGRVRALGRWTTHIPGVRDVVIASDLARDAQLSFWDALIVHSAATLGCEVLLSEDFGDGQRIATVTIRNPFSTDS